MNKLLKKVHYSMFGYFLNETRCLEKCPRSMRDKRERKDRTREKNREKEKEREKTEKDRKRENR